MDHIRNFSIIAHIDHGKSTLADCLIQKCGGLTDREMSEQVLDSMIIERERGITIKSQTAALKYFYQNDKQYYNLNLIDTPGHVDFSYEVSRSLSACEGALLIVDASQGVEAQTVANCYTAIELGIEILPVLNKIDLPQANTKNCLKEIEDIIGINTNDALLVSAKTGLGIDKLLNHIILKIPSPKGNIEKPLQALIIDSWFDNYAGVVMLIRVVNGIVKPKDNLLFMATGFTHACEQVGIFTPKAENRQSLSSGQVGFIVAGIKDLKFAKVGDTITLVKNIALKALSGFKETKPQVFAGLYSIDNKECNRLRDSLEKLKLNDGALVFEPESSEALGFGFRCGFLGLLHMEIVQERLEREFNIDVIITSPSVTYEIEKQNGIIEIIHNPSYMPKPNEILDIREPITKMIIFLPQKYIGSVMELCTKKRGIQIDMNYHGKNVNITYEIPLAEILLNFFDRLKSVSKGYASMDYKFIEYRSANVIKVDFLLNDNRIDALSIIIHRSNARQRAIFLLSRICKIIPRQMYDVKVQAMIGNEVIARENIKSLRKNVLAKCYGGDITRKKKLLEKQKAGKKRMKQLGGVEIPKEAFSAILQIEDQ
ncbi:MAG: elongation factor 4 [Bordetella sp.]|nr:MAG: elongation factor 4 [Bordetella sp.]